MVAWRPFHGWKKWWFPNHLGCPGVIPLQDTPPFENFNRYPPGESLRRFWLELGFFGGCHCLIVENSPENQNQGCASFWNPGSRLAPPDEKINGFQYDLWSDWIDTYDFRLEDGTRLMCRGYPKINDFPIKIMKINPMPSPWDESGNKTVRSMNGWLINFLGFHSR